MSILKQFINENYGLIQKLKTCFHAYGPVPNPYHLEDDVWSHTLMVYKEAEKYSDLVKICALLHDIGKIDTRKLNFEKKRTSFYGHHGVSAWKSLDILKKFNLSNDEIVQAFKLIAAHMDYHLLTPEKALKRHQKDVEFMCNFIRLGHCDDFGRICEDEREKFKFSSNKEWSKYFPGSESDSKTSRTVTLLIGPPCSGKSSYVESEASDTQVLSRDNIIMNLGEGETYNQKWQNCDQKQVDKKFNSAKNDLIKLSNDDIIVDMTNMTLKGRRKVLQGFGKDFKKKAVVFLTGFEELQRRNKDRAKEGKFISDEVMLRMMAGFSIPTFEQFDEIEWRLG